MPALRCCPTLKASPHCRQSVVLQREWQQRAGIGLRSIALEETGALFRTMDLVVLLVVVVLLLLLLEVVVPLVVAVESATIG